LFSRLTITAKGLILVLVPVVLEIGFATYLACMLTHTAAELDQVRHSISSMIDMSTDNNILISRICFCLNEGEKDKAKKMAILSDFDRMPTPLPLDREQRGAYPELAEFHDEFESFHDNLMHVGETLRTSLATQEISSAKLNQRLTTECMPIFMQGRSLNTRAFAIEKQMGSLAPEELSRFRSQFIAWLIGGFLSSCLISYFLNRAFSQDIVNRLRSIADNATCIAAGKPVSKSQVGTDEIAELDRLVYEAGLELEESRKRELAILDHATDVLCSLDLQLRLQNIGKSAKRNWGYDQDELMGRSLLSLLADEAIAPTSESFANIAAEKGKGQLETIFKCRDAKLKHFLWTINWQPAEQLFYCVAHDVTQVRALEQMKQDFLAMVSHDLRTPLNSVSLGLAILAEQRLGELPEPVIKQVSRSRTSMQRLSRLVNDLLELEKLESGRMELLREGASAFEICGFAKEPMEILAEAAGVKISGPKNDAAVFVDVQRITQVIINLLSNAIKFSPPNTVITLDLKEVGDFVEIGVADSGPGIAPEQRDLIFGRFHQATKADTKLVKSTGLGLAIVRAIVDEHGGSVGVESEIGKGSRFWFRIPGLKDCEEDL